MSDNTTSPIAILPATTADIPQLANHYWTAFADAFHQLLFNRQPESEAWWHEVHRVGLTEDSTLRTVKAVDTTTGAIVGFARWVLPQADGSLERRWPDLPPGTHSQLAEAFFGGMERSREQYMGKRPHYCELGLLFYISRFSIVQ